MQQEVDSTMPDRVLASATSARACRSEPSLTALASVKGGVSYRVNDRINVFGNVGWLFGSDYENVSANFGLNYAF